MGVFGRTSLWALACLIVAAVATPASAGKRHTRQLKKGEKLYFDQKYEEALFILEELASGDKTPKTVRLDALKLVAFSYFLLGATEQAEDAWKRLLGIEKDYRLDPVQESPEFVDFFNAIEVAGGSDPESGQAETDPEGSSKSTDSTEGTDSEGSDGKTGSESDGETKTDPAKKTETIDAVSAEQSEEAIEVPPAQEIDERGCGVVLCLLPLGIGQFANDQVLKGIIFAVLEPAFLALNLTFGLWNEAIKRPDGSVLERDRAAANERWMLQMTFFGLTVGTVLIGVLDAFIFY